MKLFYLCAADGLLYLKIYYDFDYGDYVCWKCLSRSQKIFHRTIMLSTAAQERLEAKVEEELAPKRKRR
jgi:hypothetical protein